MDGKTQEQQVQELILEAARIQREKGPEASRQFLVDAATRMFVAAAPKPPEPVPEPPRPAAPGPAVLPTDVEAGKPFVDLVRQHLPEISTQAEYDAVVGAFGTLRNGIATILSGDGARSKNVETAVSAALAAVRIAKEGSDKLREVPEAATSEAAESFKTTPKQFEEEGVQKQLIEELEGLMDTESFALWYHRTKERRAAVVTPSLRNALFDAIRSRKLAIA